MAEVQGLIDRNSIKELIDMESESLFSKSDQWSLLKGDQELEVVAHILRVILHVDKADKYRDDFLALTKFQNDDGGWAPYSTSKKSEVWGGTFCAIMLIRVNQILRDSVIDDSLRKFTNYLTNNQKEDGLWQDPSWADIDAVSHPVQFLSLIYTLANKSLQDLASNPLSKGIEFLLKNQGADGGWSDDKFYKSCVCLTAHIIQDSLLPDLLITKKVPDNVYKSAVNRLIDLQEENGAWDVNDVDHTCDTLRTLMLSTVMLEGLDRTKMDNIIQRGLKWVISVKNEDGWGDFPNEESNIERTSDAIDTLIKYWHYSKSDNGDLLKLWGYK